MRKAQRQQSKGFTLVEMLVVMAIILILSLLIYPVIVTAIKKGEGSQCISQMRQLGIAMTMHLHDHGSYPEADRYAPPGEEESIVDSLSGYIDNPDVFICPSTEAPFKGVQLSYIYNAQAKANSNTNQWLLVDGRLPGSPNPHVGDRATVLWSDGHVKAQKVVTP